MAITVFYGVMGAGMSMSPASDATWPACLIHNRIQWETLAVEIALLPALPVRRQAQRAALAVQGGFAAFMETLVLSALPDGNHGEINGKGRIA